MARGIGLLVGLGVLLAGGYALASDKKKQGYKWLDVNAGRVVALFLEFEQPLILDDWSPMLNEVANHFPIATEDMSTVVDASGVPSFRTFMLGALVVSDATFSIGEWQTWQIGSASRRARVTQVWDAENATKLRERHESDFKAITVKKLV